MPFAATWIDLEIIIINEAIQSKTNIIRYHFYVTSKAMIQMYLFTKQQQTHLVTKEEQWWGTEKSEHWD